MTFGEVRSVAAAFGGRTGLFIITRFRVAPFLVRSVAALAVVFVAAFCLVFASSFTFLFRNLSRELPL